MADVESFPHHFVPTFDAWHWRQICLQRRYRFRRARTVWRLRRPPARNTSCSFPGRGYWTPQTWLPWFSRRSPSYWWWKRSDDAAARKEPPPIAPTSEMTCLASKSHNWGGGLNWSYCPHCVAAAAAFAPKEVAWKSININQACFFADFPALQDNGDSVRLSSGTKTKFLKQLFLNFW